jgi:hypothetical protein
MRRMGLPGVISTVTSMTQSAWDRDVPKAMKQSVRESALDISIHRTPLKMLPEMPVEAYGSMSKLMGVMCT